MAKVSQHDEAIIKRRADSESRGVRGRRGSRREFPTIPTLPTIRSCPFVGRAESPSNELSVNIDCVGIVGIVRSLAVEHYAANRV